MEVVTGHGGRWGRDGWLARVKAKRTSSVKTCVVDAWAFSEWLKAAEPAASRLDDFLAASQKGLVHLYASAVNIGEVYYSLLKKNAPAPAQDWRDRAPTLPDRGSSYGGYLAGLGKSSVASLSRMLVRLLWRWRKRFVGP
jgi:hypothetical protein